MRISAILGAIVLATVIILIPWILVLRARRKREGTPSANLTALLFIVLATGVGSVNFLGIAVPESFRWVVLLVQAGLIAAAIFFLRGVFRARRPE